MTRRILLDDALATAPFTLPLTAGWLDSPPAGLTVEARLRLVAGDVGPEDVALLPAGDYPVLQETHRLAPDAAIIFGETGTIVLRCPVRPDEIEATPVRLWQTSGTGEALARATVQPFYGIRPLRWTDDDEAEAQVVVVEGAEALRPPEAGFAEDLVRAWFILTGEAAVSHVLAVPRAAERGDLAPVLTTIAALREVGHARRRDLRRAVAERHALPPEPVAALYARMRFALETAGRRALQLLLQRGRGGERPALARPIDYLEP